MDGGSINVMTYAYPTLKESYYEDEVRKFILEEMNTKLTYYAVYTLQQRNGEKMPTDEEIMDMLEFHSDISKRGWNIINIINDTRSDLNISSDVFIDHDGADVELSFLPSDLDIEVSPLDYSTVNFEATVLPPLMSTLEHSKYEPYRMLRERNG
jgi:hypothetical protein